MAAPALHLHTAAEADRLLGVATVAGISCAVCTGIVTENPYAALVILAVPLYGLARRYLKGPPTGAPVLELSGEMLILRDVSTAPPTTERIAVRPLRQIKLSGRRKAWQLDLIDKHGNSQHFGPLKRLPPANRIHTWLGEHLPKISFDVTTDSPPGNT